MREQRYNKHIEVCPLSQIDSRRDFWMLCWDIQGDSYETTIIKHKPTLNEIKTIILDWYNAKTEDKIINGFEWNGIPVHLTRDNQHNYALFAEAGLIPIELKLGTPEEPVFYKFTTMSELKDFKMEISKHIKFCLQLGWAQKNNIDWEVYENLLNN